eukprot:5931137-Pyramimonas_sp.AAC.1
MPCREAKSGTYLPGGECGFQARVRGLPSGGARAPPRAARRAGGPRGGQGHRVRRGGFLTAPPQRSDRLDVRVTFRRSDLWCGPHGVPRSPNVRRQWRLARLCLAPPAALQRPRTK